MNLPFTAPNAVLKMKKSNYRKLRRHQRIKALLQELGIEEAGYPGRNYNDHWCRKIDLPSCWRRN